MSNNNQSVPKLPHLFINLNKSLLPFVITITLLFLIIESVTFPGFIQSHLYIDTKLFMALNIAMLIVFIFTRRRKNEVTKKTDLDMMELVIKGSYLALPILAINYYIMVAIESTKYPNYIFSVIHVNPDSFFNIIVFTAIIALFSFLSSYDLDNLSLYYGNINIKSKNNKIQSFITFIFFVTLGVFLLQNILLTSKRIIKSDIYIIVNRNASYDEKMYESWHFFYQYMKFIKENTAENSSIAIPPPIRPWLSEGNSVLVRYFLFPRYIVTIEDESGKVVKPDYYIISKGIWKATNESEYGWPKDKIEAEEIIYLNDTDFSTKVVRNVTYDPELKENKYGWGLIKVKK